MPFHGWFAVWFAGLVTIGVAQKPAHATPPSSPPTVVSPIHPGGNFVSLSHRAHPDNMIGYRFHEHSPFVFGAVPTGSGGIDPAATERLEREFAERSGVVVYKREVREEGWHPQNWTYYLAPAADGFDLLWVVETQDAGLNEYYAAQQCFRMSGVTNADWRRRIAETPAFSEFDLWAGQEQAGEPLTSLSHVRSQERWNTIPAMRNHVGYRTPLGLDMDTKRTDGDLDAADLAPYGPTTFEGDIDCGLAARTDLAGEWVCAIFWERTTHVTNHHPADCLHAVVNLGSTPARSKRAIRGKIYWMKASLDELYETWRADFPSPEE